MNRRSFIIRTFAAIAGFFAFGKAAKAAPKGRWQRATLDAQTKADLAQVDRLRVKMTRQCMTRKEIVVTNPPPGKTIMVGSEPVEYGEVWRNTGRGELTEEDKGRPKIAIGEMKFVAPSGTYKGVPIYWSNKLDA